MSELKRRKVKCYNCDIKTGIAYLVKRLIFSRKEKKMVNTLVWNCNNFKMISLNAWLCKKCDEKRCKHCGIVLSNKRVCKSCGVKHGAFYPKHPKYCEKCWDARFKLRSL